MRLQVLLSIRFRATPRRAALEIIRALEEGQLTLEFVLRLLGRMKRDLSVATAVGQPDRHSENVAYLYFLIQLYGRALTQLLDAMSRGAQVLERALHIPAEAGSTELITELLTASKEIAICCGVLELIRSRHFNARGVPQHLADASLGLHLQLLTVAFCRSANPAIFEQFGLIDHQALTLQAEQNLADLESSAQAGVSATDFVQVMKKIGDSQTMFSAKLKSLTVPTAAGMSKLKQEIENCERAKEQRAPEPKSHDSRQSKSKAGSATIDKLKKAHKPK